MVGQEPEKRLAMVGLARSDGSKVYAPINLRDTALTEAIVNHNFQEMIDIFRQDCDTNEQCAGRQGASAYYIHREGLWKKAYATFQDFCNAQGGRGYSTIVELMNNYEYFVKKSGYDLKRYFALSRKLGWTVLREVRMRKLEDKLLDQTVEEIERKDLSREEVKEKLDKFQPAEIDRDEGETRSAPKWQTVKVQLPPSEYERLIDAVEDIKKEQGVKGLAQAIMYMVTQYWDQVG